MIHVDDINKRYRGAYVVEELLNAHRALEQARDHLTRASLAIAELSGTTELRKEIERLRHQLYADRIESSGGDGLAWDTRSLMLLVGQLAATPGESA